MWYIDHQEALCCSGEGWKSLGTRIRILSGRAWYFSRFCILKFPKVHRWRPRQNIGVQLYGAIATYVVPCLIPCCEVDLWVGAHGHVVLQAEPVPNQTHGCELDHTCTGPGCVLCHIQQEESWQNSASSCKDMFSNIPFSSNSTDFPRFYSAEQHINTLNMKVHSGTPSVLPSNLDVMMAEVMQVSTDGDAMLGYIRPGCVHLTVDTLMDTSEHLMCVQEDLPLSLHQMLSTGPWVEHTVTVQSASGLMTFRDGVLISTSPLPCDIPAIIHMSIAIAGNIIQALVRNFDPLDTSLLIRFAGDYVPFEYLKIFLVDVDVHAITIRYNQGSLQASHGIASGASMLGAV